jgi:hypothetical protein
LDLAGRGCGDCFYGENQSLAVAEIGRMGINSGLEVGITFSTNWHGDVPEVLRHRHEDRIDSYEYGCTNQVYNRSGI